MACLLCTVVVDLTICTASSSSSPGVINTVASLDDEADMVK